jgi:excinuclease UvrABC nuclease subunit
MKKNKSFKTSFLSAYNEQGKPNIRSLDASKKQSGVYFIKNTQDEIVYVGFSSTQLYKTVYRHFQKWTDVVKTNPRYTYPKTYKVRIIFTTPERAATLEKYLIKKLKPRDNNFKYENYFLTEIEIKDSIKTISEAEQFSNLDEPPF